MKPLRPNQLEIRPVLEIGNPLQICELVKTAACFPFFRILFRRNM